MGLKNNHNKNAINSNRVVVKTKSMTEQELLFQFNRLGLVCNYVNMLDLKNA